MTTSRMNLGIVIRISTLELTSKTDMYSMKKAKGMIK